MLLDICDTVVNFQTANRFVLFVLKRYSMTLFFISKFYRIIGYFAVLFNFKFNYKIYILKLLKGTSKKQLNEIAKCYFDSCVIGNFNGKVLEYIERIRTNNPSIKVIIVSGGYDMYLKYISDYISADYQVCNELKFSNDIFTGNINGYDCMNQFKILKLSETGLLPMLKYDETVVISDSYSDLPLFSLGKFKVAVNPDKKLSSLIGYGWEEIT